MKKLTYIILFLAPCLALGQYDFDTRYFTIDETSLPEVPNYDTMLELGPLTEQAASTFTLDNTPTFEATLRSLRISSSNYWEPVDMRTAVGSSETYIDTNLNISPLKNRSYEMGSYSADGATKVKNTVYTEVRGLDLLDPCPPIGICPRCAPYRFNQGY